MRSFTERTMDASASRASRARKRTLDALLMSLETRDSIRDQVVCLGPATKYCFIGPIGDVPSIKGLVSGIAETVS